jgi:large repetitive protein
MTGSTSVCQGSSQTYSVTAIPNATSYTWTLPSGWSGTSSTNIISTTVGSNSGTITVTANNSCGSSAPSILNVNVTALPGQPGPITGPTSVARGTTVTYSISAVQGATSYIWTLPSGWTGSSITTSIDATAGTNALSGNITVASVNSCGQSQTSSLPVVVGCNPPAQPGSISGSTSVCQGSTRTYTISAVTGATSYTWSLPNGWSGTSNTASINATAGQNAVSGTIAVTANNSCGSSTQRILNVSVTNVPAQAGPITGSTSVCQGSSQTYSLTAVPNATSYTWTLPSGWIGTSSTNIISTTVGSNSGTITVTANNSCGSSAPSILNVNVTALPGQPGPITGPASVTRGTTVTYSIAAVQGATSYIWTLPSGWTGSSTTTSIEATAGPNALSGNITVAAINSCGQSQISSLPVQAGDAPVLSVTPPSRSVTSSAGVTTFTVTSNVVWTPSENYDWLSVTKTNETMLTVSYNQNTSLNSRTATITISGTSVTSQHVSVIQDGPFLKVYYNNQLLSNFGTVKIDQSTSGTLTLNIESSVTWEISENSLWFNANKQNNSVIITYLENISTSNKNGEIQFKYGDGNIIIIYLDQKGRVSNLGTNKLLNAKIYPNPSIDHVYMVFGEVSFDKIDVIITNLFGNPVNKKTYFNVIENQILDIDVASLPTGDYMVIIRSGNEQKTFNVIKF